MYEAEFAAIIFAGAGCQGSMLLILEPHKSSAIVNGTFPPRIERRTWSCRDDTAPHGAFSKQLRRQMDGSAAARPCHVYTTCKLAHETYLCGLPAVSFCGN
jgi:hypothetical protein